MSMSYNDCLGMAISINTNNCTERVRCEIQNFKLVPPLYANRKCGHVENVSVESSNLSKGTS